MKYDIEFIWFPVIRKYIAWFFSGRENVHIVPINMFAILIMTVFYPVKISIKKAVKE